MAMNTLDDLFLHELKDTYDAEHQITKALPKMMKAANSPELKAAFQTHLTETEAQITRLDQVFDSIGKKASRVPCDGMKGIIKEGESLIEEDGDPMVKDVGLIASAQRVEHYEITAYGTLRALAKQLGYKDAVKLLGQTLDEESATDEKLTALAQSTVNVQAPQ